MQDAHTFQGLGVNLVCDAQSGVVVPNSSSPEAQLLGNVATRVASVFGH